MVRHNPLLHIVCAILCAKRQFVLQSKWSWWKWHQHKCLAYPTPRVSDLTDEGCHNEEEGFNDRDMTRLLAALCAWQFLWTPHPKSLGIHLMECTQVPIFDFRFVCSLLSFLLFSEMRSHESPQKTMASIAYIPTLSHSLDEPGLDETESIRA